jgi:adenylate cyclase
MTLEQLVDRIGVDAATIQRWVELDLLHCDDSGHFDGEALERARLLHVATRRGIAEEQIAAATRRAGDIVGRYVELVSPSATAVITPEEAAARTGLDPDFLRRVRIAAGIGADELSDDDVTALRAVRTALDAGLPEDALLQLNRVYADALDRVADAETRLFHFYVHDRLRSEGLDVAEASAAADAATEMLLGLVEPTILHFHRRALARAVREDVLVHLAEEVAPPGTVGQLTVAVLFVDLVGFTALTESMGDEAAATVLDRFSELVRDEAVHCDGRVIKQIGDEFMLVFPDAATAVNYGLHLAEAASAQTEFPRLRIGIHTGPALYREADYLGTTINTAARITDLGEPGQLIITDAVHSHAADLAGWTSLGPRRLKGMSAQVHLFATDLAPGRAFAIDPVCGMTVDPDRAITNETTDEVFCSQRCADSYPAP